MSGKDQGGQGRSKATEIRRLEKRVTQPPVFRVFFTDRASVYAISISLAFAAPLLYDAFTSQLAIPGFITYLLAGVAAVAAFLPLWHVRSIRRVFAEGVEVPGLITGIRFAGAFVGNKGYVTYTYAYRGVTYEGYNLIMRTRRANALRPGHQVRIVLRPDSPEDAEIRELYL